MEEKEFQIQYRKKIAAAEEIIRQYLPEEKGYQKTVQEAMNYSLMAGGKRLRPILMQEVYHMLGGNDKLVEPFMAAIEMIHTYSLVHDDLPAMDNDRYRRGKETTWAVYGEAMGILAGDALLNYAFETVLKELTLLRQTAGGDRQLLLGVRALQILAEKSGIGGMIGGQTADIEAEEQTEALTTPQLLFIHEHKTAALIQAAMMAGAVLAGAEDAQLAAIAKCGYNIGVAFQIQDDVLDVIGNSEELGKPVGSDEQNHKQTYVTLNGIEASRREVERLSQEAVELLKHFAGEHDFLEQLIRNLINRRS